MSEIDKLIDRKIKQFENDLEEIAYKELKPFVEDELKMSVVKNLYGRPESDWYDRTGMTYNSITGFARKTVNGLDIYAITDLENTKPRHTSVINGEESYNGTVIDEHLDTWLEYGHGGLFFDDGTLMFAEAQYSIDKKAKRLIKSKLKSKGYKVKG